MVILLMPALLTTPADASRDGKVADGSVDISGTPIGKARIAESARSLAGLGGELNERDLVAREFADGTILVALRGISVADERQAGGGFHFTLDTATGGAPGVGDALEPAAVEAAPYWSMTAQQCFASLFRGVSHMDACYKIYKMANDGISTSDYWRLDWYATMFTASSNRTLDWGWIHADQDGGPVMSWVDWSPDADLDQGCGTFGLSITVAGVGGGFSSTFCEVQDISKSAGTTMGWFKDQWGWGGWAPKSGVDRKVAMLLGTRTTQGAGYPVWGLSWDFAAHG
jgi:hypothetical protein